MRICVEVISGIGAPIAVWEAIKLAYKNKELRRLKSDIKKTVKHIRKTEINFKLDEEKKTEVLSVVSTGKAIRSLRASLAEQAKATRFREKPKQ